MNRLGKGNKGEAERTDAELVLASRGGDKRAFVEIVGRHQAMVCGVALGIVGDFAASEDAGQEAFLTAWRKFHELREPERLRAWLAQIARNAALGHLRRKRGEAPLDAVEMLQDESPAPDEVAATEEEAELVRDSLAKLPEIYRLPLILFYREGQSVRAVAESLAISEDAVKQRLARGREMLRDRMSGLVETILKRSTPTAIFTMTVAVAIGALAAPAVIASSVFAASTSTSSSILAAMSTSKTILATAAVVTAICVPVGYYVSGNHNSSSRFSSIVLQSKAPTNNVREPSFENSALFREWRALHDKYGRTAEAMPAIYKAIADIKDPFRRRTFRAALIAEWVQLDAAGGFTFLHERRSDGEQRKQFLAEWLARDARAAVDAMLASGPGWESMARDNLTEIARRVPDRLADIVSRLPKTESYWDTKVRDAFATFAESGLSSAKAAAERITGDNREQALAGVAKAWAKSDLQGALAWIKDVPEVVDRDEIIRAALLGKAAVDPGSALDLIGLVPPGGRDTYYASSTGARVLAEAAKTDYDATVAWIAAHPGRISHHDILGLVEEVSSRLNADPTTFLSTHAADGSLSAIRGAVESALLNEAAGQHRAVWDWLKNQPQTDTIKSFKKLVLGSIGWQDPKQGLELVKDLPHSPEGDAQVQKLAQSFFNGGYMNYQFDNFIAQAPERLRQPLIEAAFKSLSSHSMDDPQRWIERLDKLPENFRAGGTEYIARAWSEQRLDEAVEWVRSLETGEARALAAAAITSTWVAKDPQGATEWVAAMSPDERERSVGRLVYGLLDQYPQQAWEWALTIRDPQSRTTVATHVATQMAARDPGTARHWIESSPLPPEAKAAFNSNLNRAGK